MSGFRGTFEEGRLKMDAGYPSLLRDDTRAALSIYALHPNALARQLLHKHLLSVVLPALPCRLSVFVFIISLLPSSMYRPILSLICLSVCPRETGGPRKGRSPEGRGGGRTASSQRQEDEEWVEKLWEGGPGGRATARL